MLQMSTSATRRPLMPRGLRRAPGPWAWAWWLGLLVLVELTPAHAVENVRVVLRTREIVEGRAFEHGRETIELVLRRGRRSIHKNAIDRCTFLGTQEIPEQQGSVLVLQNGHEVAGTVEFSADTGAWLVTLPVGQARYADTEVMCMVLPTGVASNGTFTPRDGFTRRVHDAIAGVRSDSALGQSQGQEFLRRAGYFALRLLEEALAADPSPRLQRLVTEQRLLAAVPLEVERDVPDFLSLLRTGTTEQRLRCLREVFLARGEECFPLYSVLVQDEDQPPEVRGYCVDLLRRMGEVKQLVDAYRNTTGRAQLAVAIALGDAGLFIGIPTLIEALEVPDVEAQQLAASKLEEYTGERFGFEAGADESVRRTALARWQGWWRAHRESIEELLVGRLGSDTENPARARARALCGRANVAWAGGDFDLAYDTFREASNVDPTSLQPLLGLGVLCYTQRGELREAEEWFRRAMKRPAEDSEQEVVRLLYYHLGRLHLNRLEYEQARGAFQRAVSLGPDHADTWFDLGRASYMAAVYASDLSPEVRRTRFGEAARVFEDGVDHLRKYRDGLVVMSSSQLPGDALPFSAREHNRSLREFKEHLRAREGRFAHEIARARLATGEVEKAFEWAQRAAESPEPKPDDHLLLATILEAQGKAAEAASERDKAERLRARLAEPGHR